MDGNVMMLPRLYRGLPKPGHAVFEGAVQRGGTGGTLVRSRSFARYLGQECLEVASAGVTDVAGRLQPRPVAVLTDLLQHQPGRPGGLVVEGAGEPAWVAATRLLLDALEREGILTVLPADQHLNPDLLDRAAETSFELVEGMLAPEETVRLRQDPARLARLRAGGRMTLADYEAVFGPVVDKEDRNFVPHCHEGVVEYIPCVLSLLGRQRARVLRQAETGVLVPSACVLPDFKTGLSCLSAPDGRGLHGNALRDVLAASQRGLYLDGDARPHAKLALVGGTAHEYSVAELIRFLVDMDYSVVWLMACTGGLGISAKLATALDLMERYGTRLFCTYDWPLPEHLGPAPAGWAPLAAQVRQEDDGELQQAEQARAALLAARKTGQGRPLVVDGATVGRARVPAGRTP
ncbi:MAG: hypothetical protein HY904_15015 [Deltaproteobacteria bacterium]|nr:hypothetical protein [Deltaproteobacteria bacterium]